MVKKQSEKSSDMLGLSGGKKALPLVLLSKVSVAICLIATAGLFAGLYDLGFINLTEILPKYAPVFLVVAILAALSGAFAISKASSLDTALSQQQAALFNNKIEEKVAAVEGKVEAFLGENYNRMREENESLKKEFEQIRDSESKKIVMEIEELKIENADLRDKLNTRIGMQEDTVVPADHFQVA